MSAGWRMREWAQLTDEERAILLGDKRLEPSVPPDPIEGEPVTSRSFWTQTVEHPVVLGVVSFVIFLAWLKISGQLS